ncbi:MAG: MarR family transcriptional regulator [Gemmatimonadales bacterium]
MTAPLGMALHRLARRHRAQLAHLLAAHGVHAGQDMLLCEVWEEPGLRQAALATRLGVEAATITRMVQRLERGGLVERRRDPHDGRVSRIHPTPRSRLLEAGVRHAWAQLEETMVSQLGPDADLLRELADLAAESLAALKE